MFGKVKKAASITFNIFKYSLWSSNQFSSELAEAILGTDWAGDTQGFSNNKKRAAIKIIRELFEGDDEIIQKFQKSMAAENMVSTNDYIDSLNIYITDEEIREYGLVTKAYQYDPAYSGLSPFDETTGWLLMQEGKPTKIWKETFLEKEINYHRKKITKIKKELKILEKNPSKKDEESIERKKQLLKKMNHVLPRLKREYVLIQAGMGSFGFKEVMKRISFILPKA